MIEILFTWVLAAAADRPQPEVPLHHPFSEQIFRGLGTRAEDCGRRGAARFGPGTVVDCAYTRLKTEQFLDGWRRSFPDGVASETVRPLSDWMEIFRGWWRRYYEVDGTPVIVAYGGRSKGLFIAYHEGPEPCGEVARGLPLAGQDGVSLPERVEEPWTAPAYPLAARRRRLNGMVLMRAGIDRQGKLGQICVLDALPRGYGFEAAAIDAVRAVRYHPAAQDGQPVDAAVVLVRTFDID